MDRGAWRATVYGDAELDMTERLSLSTFLLRDWYCARGHGRHIKVRRIPSRPLKECSVVIEP